MSRKSGHRFSEKDMRKRKNLARNPNPDTTKARLCTGPLCVVRLIQAHHTVCQVVTERPGGQIHNSSRLSGTSPNFFRIVASAKLPRLGSPERMNDSAPALAGSRDMISALRLASGAL